MTRVHETITAVVQKIAVALAPYLTTIADKFVDAGKQGGGFGNKVTGAVEMVATGVAYATDTLKLFDAGWQFLKIGVLAVTDGVLHSIDFVGAGIVKLINLLPGVEVQWTDTFSEMARSLEDQIGEASDKATQDVVGFANHENAQKVSAFFDGVKKSAEENAQKVADAADKMHGAFQPSQTMFKEGAAPMDAAVKLFEDHLKDLAAEAGKIKEAMEPPTEKLKDYAAKLQEMVNDGLLSADQANQALAKQAEDAAKGMLGGDAEIRHQDQFAGFIKAGSNEAAKLQMELSRGADNDMPSKQLAEQQKGNSLLRDLVGKFDFVAVTG